jgi:5-(carboxyamino)imidazole ribonucleotide synthase
MTKIHHQNFKLGILGGGQLGRMLIQEAINFDIDLYIMDDSQDSPCAKYAANYHLGNIRDFDDVYSFGKDLSVLTIEIENVNVEALYKLQEEGVKVFPQPEVIELIQDKGKQKKFYRDNEIPTSDFVIIENIDQIKQNLNRLPFMQKLCKGGYDGKGVQAIKTETDISKAFDAPSVLENFVDMDKELSVIVARNESGECSCFPIVEQEFSEEANLVEFLFTPADLSKEIEAKAANYAIQIIEKLDMIGLLAIEFFLSTSGELMVNEMAPRPHNSGHQTIEGNYTSQFEQHIRAITNLPLGSTELIQPSVMINLLGAKGHEGNVRYKGLEDILKLQGVYPHLYGKKKTKPFRKMGHVTILNPSLNKAQEIALEVKDKISVIGE